MPTRDEIEASILSSINEYLQNNQFHGVGGASVSVPVGVSEVKNVGTMTEASSKVTSLKSDNICSKELTLTKIYKVH